MSRYRCKRDVIIEIDEEEILSDDESQDGEISYDMVVCDICNTRHWPAIPNIAFDDRRGNGCNVTFPNGKSGSKDVGGYTSVYDGKTLMIVQDLGVDGRVNACDVCIKYLITIGKIVIT